MNAHLKIAASKSTTITPGPTPDGGYLVSPEDILRLGDGDVKVGRRRMRMMIADMQEPKRHDGPTEAPTTVRIAHEKDEFGILSLLVRTCSMETPRWMPVSADRILHQIRLGTRGEGGVVGVIDSPDGVPIAATVLVIAQPAHSLAHYIQDIFNAVHPDYRNGTSHAHDLVMFGHWFSDEMTRKFGYPVYYVSGVHSLGRVQQKMRFFGRYNTQIGATYVYPTP